MARLLRLGFLASHQGSNMQAILDACKQGRLAAQPAVVISNNSDSGALARARQEHIPAFHLSSHTHPGPGALDQAIWSHMIPNPILNNATETPGNCIATS